MYTHSPTQEPTSERVILISIEKQYGYAHVVSLFVSILMVS